MFSCVQEGVLYLCLSCVSVQETYDNGCSAVCSFSHLQAYSVLVFLQSGNLLTSQHLLSYPSLYVPHSCRVQHTGATPLSFVE